MLNFNIGEYVVYCSGEICRIDERSERCFDGVSKKEYCKLIPVDAVNSAYYIPSEYLESKARRLLTKDEIYKMIDSMPNASGTWYTDKNERKDYFEAVLKSDDIPVMIGMMKTIYDERSKLSANGKRLVAADERAFSAAEHLINREFAFVLGIKENDVSDFIQRRLAAEIA
ncbi:MAG: hypothetical protein HDT25_08665 [Ruminococcus sp.]|nr:hypothetical protein [Ruminococcus sp.]